MLLSIIIQISLLHPTKWPPAQKIRQIIWNHNIHVNINPIQTPHNAIYQSCSNDSIYIDKSAHRATNSGGWSRASISCITTSLVLRTIIKT